MIIVFIGPPGAGKGTQCERLAQHLRVPHLSTGEVLREAKHQGTRLGKEAAEYMDRGQLVPDELVTDLVKQRLGRDDCRRGCLLDGYPRTVAQAEALLAFLATEGTPLATVIELQAIDEELVRRLLDRRRDDDTRETIENRLAVYNTQTAPVLAFFQDRGLLRSVDGMGTPDAVFADIQKLVDGG